MIITYYFGKVSLTATLKDHAPDIQAIRYNNSGPTTTFVLGGQSTLLAANGSGNIAVPTGLVQLPVPTLGPGAYRFPTEKVSFK